MYMYPIYKSGRGWQSANWLYIYTFSLDISKEPPSDTLVCVGGWYDDENMQKKYVFICKLYNLFMWGIKMNTLSIHK